MQRRIYGVETEYGVTCTFEGQRKLSPDEIARYLFRRVVTWGRSSNVFLENGARLYLDVGSHPEYATAECDDLKDLIAHDKAGEKILENMLVDAQERLHNDGVNGNIYLFKNNTDSAGNSYGCHENYLIERGGTFSKMAEVLLPFLVTRQLITGAGKIHQTPRTATYCLSQRAEHIWEGVSSATTRSRPIINTRDEPHADAEKYRRLHVIVGDSNMSEPTTALKVGSSLIILEMIEAGVPFKDLTLDNPIRAIREISHDISGKVPVKLLGGKTASALDIQNEYLQRVQKYFDQRESTPLLRYVVDLWERTLTAVSSENYQSIETEIDWVIKKRLIERYCEKNSMDLHSPRLAQIDLAYHDIRRDRGLYHLLCRKKLARQIIDNDDIDSAVNHPPETTRARLRGHFIAAAKKSEADYTVDWVHLKVNAPIQKTFLCKDPFKNTDTTIEKIFDNLDGEEMEDL